MIRLVSTAIGLCILAGLGHSEAAFVTYTETGVGSGSLGGVAFSGASITITGTADTTNVQTSGSAFIVLTSTTVSVQGFSTAIFTDTIQAVDNQAFFLAGFGDNTTNFFILGNHNVAFTTYDLKTSIGPLSGSPVYNSGNSFATDMGAFVINSIDSAPAFSAVVGAVPEPSSLAMAGLGVALAATWGRSRSRHQAVGRQD